MAFPKLIIITVFCVIFVKTQNSNIERDISGEDALKVNSVLDYLTINSNGLYEYKSGSLISAQPKGDVTEVTVEVNVDCLRTYPDIPCNERELMCHAFIGQNSDLTYYVLSDVKCNPKIEIIVEDVDKERNAPPMAQRDENEGQMENIDLSSEALSPAQGGADFVAVHKDVVPCLGCPFDLDTDAEQIEELINTAVRHIESERNQRHKVINVRRLQQQVVAGIKYILLAEVAQTVCPKDADLSTPCILDTAVEPFICEITFIQKPWISSSKHIIKNNCTESQEFEPVDFSKRDEDMNNEILPQGGFANPIPEGNPKPVPNYNAMAQTGHMEDEMDAARLADLESQILFGDMFESPKVSKVASPKNIMPCTVEQLEQMSVDEPLPTVIDVDSLKVEPISIENSQQQYQIPMFSSAPVVDESEPIVTVYNYQNDEQPKTSDENIVNKLEDNLQYEQRLKRETVSESEESNEEGGSSEEKQINGIRTKRANKKDNDDDSSSSSSSDDDDDNDNNNDKENKKEKLQKSNKDNDDNNNNDSSSSSSSSSSDEEENKRHRRSIGQMEKITPEEKVYVRDLADFAAAALDNIDDDNHKRVILQILGAKKLKLDGIYYQIILRLGISHCHEHEHNENCREKLLTNLTKICKVQIHVEDDYSNPKVVKSQCQNIKKDENDRNRTNYSRYRRRAVLVGGHTPIATNDSYVRKFVDATLDHLDSTSGDPNKHKAVEIVSATSQVVAGIRYIVTVKIGLSDCAKTEEKLSDDCNLLQNSEPETCTIDVWDRPWLKKTIYRINCNDKVYNFGDEEQSTRRKRSIPGGQQEIPRDSEEVLNHLQRSLIQLDASSEHENKYIVDQVLFASRQVVAGSLTRIHARLSLSDCKKGSPIEQNCTKLNDAQNHTTVCKFKIWEKPWLNFTQTNVTCGNHQSHSFRSKREISNDFGSRYLLGTDKELPTEHKEANGFVQMAVKYLSSKLETPGQYEVKNVKRVTRRIEAGSLWNIDADIALCRQVKLLRSFYSSCPKQNEYISCHFKVTNQPWLADGLTINIICENDNNIYTYVPIKGLNDELGSFDFEPAFKQFARKYNKVYMDSEYNYRLRVFRDNANKIALLNKYEKGTARYGFTEYADLTEKEFSERHGYRSELRSDNELPFARATIPDIKLPTEFDWRTKGAVTEIKNQGFCGSCWAFSVTGNVEGQYAIKHGQLLEFSEQELVDCDKVDQGCNGGLMDNAYRVIEKLGGLETESDYPYEGDDEQCHFNISKAKAKVTGALNISHDETDMAKWLVQNGPISIAINANAMQFYMGGVSHPWKTLCSPNSLDHGVLIVGYGVHQYSLFNRTLPYWIVKNSWGTSWGEQGYYRVYRGDGTCGLNQTPSSAIVA